MAAYTTIAELITYAGQNYVLISGDRNADALLDTEAVQANIDDGASLIDLFVGQVATLPLDDPPVILRRINQDFALYTLSADVDSYTEEKRKRYEDGMAILQKIADGKIKLPGGDPDEQIENDAKVYYIETQRNYTRRTQRWI